MNSIKRWVFYSLKNDIGFLRLEEISFSPRSWIRTQPESATPGFPCLPQPSSSSSSSSSPPRGRRSEPGSAFPSSKRRSPWTRKSSPGHRSSRCPAMTTSRGSEIRTDSRRSKNRYEPLSHWSQKLKGKLPWGFTYDCQACYNITVRLWVHIPGWT